MRSRRSVFESACRLGAFAVIGWLLGIALTPSSGRVVERATVATLGTQLPRWTIAPANLSIHAELATAPERWAIDWLAALGHAGRPVAWHGSPPPVAIATEALVDPLGSVEIAVAAPAGAAVFLRDEASSLASVRVARNAAAVTSPVLVGAVSAATMGQAFAGATPDSLTMRPVVVIGRAGWEGKFVAAALAEQGWTVNARFTIAPNVDVTDGAIVLDTARVSAVVVVDSSMGSFGAAIARFVADGGGLVLAGTASLAPALTSLAPGTLGARLPPPTLTVDTLGRASAGYYPVVALRRDAIPVERRADGLAVAARRVGAGRVIAVGFDESWRWRMAGGPDAEAAHRAWWSRIVASVAYGSVVARSDDVSPAIGAAPLAELVDRMGASRASPTSAVQRWTPDPRLLLTLIALLLLLEWGSRRMRGAR